MHSERPIQGDKIYFILIVPSPGEVTSRTDGRAGGRAAKQACKAGDEKTRAECRHVKRTTKHDAGEVEVKPNEAPATNPAR